MQERWLRVILAGAYFLYAEINQLMKKYHRGDVMSVHVERAGLEPDEGIAHLPDETMVIVLGGGDCVGKQCDVVITSDIQTSLGDSLIASLKAS